MRTSRSVDSLTYTYYTGQDVSEPHGPNCHNCMNELFHEKKLLDVQTVFITTPKIVIPFLIRALVFNYGMETPFTMTSFAEDFLVLRCKRCTEKAMLLQVYEAAKDDKQSAAKENERKRKINTVCSLEADSEVSSSSSMAKRLKTQAVEASHSSTNSTAHTSDDITIEVRQLLIDCLNHIDKATSSNSELQPAKSCIEDSREKDHNLPFQYGRNPADVEDPMSIDDRSAVNILRKYTMRTLNRSSTNVLVATYFAKQKIFTCKHCDLTFHSSKCCNLIVHLVSEYHFSKVAEAGLVFSHSGDLQRLEELSNEAFNEVFAASLYNKVACLNRSGLMDVGFSHYVFLMDPNIKNMNSCAACEIPISCKQNADNYLKHFLSSSHIEKVLENKCNMGSDCGNIASLLSNYLAKSGRKGNI